MLSRVKEAIKFVGKGLVGFFLALMLHSAAHEYLHWIPAYLLGLHPSDITLTPFQGGSLEFIFIFPEAVIPILMPFWVLSAVGTYLIAKATRDFNPLMAGIGWEMILHEMVYQLGFGMSDLNRLALEFKSIGILITLELMIIAFTIERADKTHEDRPSLFRRAVQSLRAIRLPAFLSKRRESKNHRKEG
jgi:hypothetical protein